MHQQKFKLNKLYQSILYCSLAIPAFSNAQEAKEIIEEVVVTGSYIKREKFDSASPIEVITANQLKQQGAPSMGQVVRELTISQNTNTVSNVLGTQDGAQDSTTPSFNLRGLGGSSTLTLFDGRRVISDNVGSLVPDIALDQVQIVLDGGAATYGSDAVAGVVNFIPIKEYDGIKASIYYNQDDSRDFKEPKVAILAGKSFDNGINWVGAIDLHKREALRRSDRSTYLAYDDDDSVFGSPGTFAGLLGVRRDPNCGVTTPDPSVVDDTEQGAFLSGRPETAFGQPVCRFEFGEFQDYLKEQDKITAYTNVTYDMNDSLTFEFQGNWTKTDVKSLSTAATGNSTSNGNLVIPSTHPDNTFGFTVVPLRSFYRPFGKYGTLPSDLDQGAASTEFETLTERYKIGARYDIGNTSWSGETYLGYHRSTTDTSANTIVQSRLQSALRGFGGAGCNELTGSAGSGPCEYFNPFYSAHPGDSIAGTVNSQRLVDYIYARQTYESDSSEFTYLDSFVTGELFELPAGAVMIAAGIQYREEEEQDNPSPIALSGDSYNNPETVYKTDNSSEVNAYFLEFDVPILDNLNLIGALRREEFKTYDLSTTVPKVSVRYEPIEGLAFRGSYGEGFVAPALNESGPFQANAQCVEVFTATPDPLIPGDTLTGASSCFSPNPDIGPEESTLKNIGVTWQAADGLELSLDYQKIEFEDRIVSLASKDLIDRDYANYLSAVDSGDIIETGTPAVDLQTWLDSGLSDPLVERDPLNSNEVVQVTRIPINATSNTVGVYDFAARYSFESDIGYFITSFRASGFSRYESKGSEGEKATDRIGQQNAGTNLAPPLPRWKSNLRFSWMNDNHSASIGVDYLDGVEFDDTVDDSPYKNRTAPKSIGSHTTFDVRYSYLFESLLGGEVQLTLGSNNVTDSNPDPLPINGGLETRLHDPFGRTVYLEMTYEPSF